MASAALPIAAMPRAEWNWVRTDGSVALGGEQLGSRQRLPGIALDTDATLVERCLSGHEAAWEDLVKTHTRRVYSICYRFTSRDSEAQDLTQDVFLRVFKNLRSFRAGEGSFVVWLTRLTRNLLIDHYRRTRLDRATESLEEQGPAIEEKATTFTRTDGILAGREASEV